MLSRRTTLASGEQQENKKAIPLDSEDCVGRLKRQKKSDKLMMLKEKLHREIREYELLHKCTVVVTFHDCENTTDSFTLIESKG